MNNRVLNLLLCIGCLALAIAFPIRKLFFTELPPEESGMPAGYSSYVTLFLYGGLTLVFAFRALKGDQQPREGE